jgi:hypothetical protein
MPAALHRLGVGAPTVDTLPKSTHRFPDGARYHVEIPSVEGPDAFSEVVAAADRYGVRVHRVSQGSGIMLQTDAEIREMVALGEERDIEVCLFTGPRAAWDIGAQAKSSSGSVVAASARGHQQLLHALKDVERACALGLRSVLLGDLGVVWAVAQLRAAGDLPAELIIKSSVALPAANPASARVLTELGVDTVNLPVDLSIDQIATIRAAIDHPLDCYIEGPDDFGAPVRHHEIPDIVRVAAPVHLKFTVRNSAGIYPAGEQLRSLVLASARERVRRAAIGLELLGRDAPELLTE